MDLTKCGMEQNLVIHWVDNSIKETDAKAETPMFKSTKERCKQDVLNFFKQEMRVDLEAEDIWKAHRTGLYKQNKVRPMVVKLSYAAKDLVMENLGELKGKKNCKTDQVFFISEQIPEGISELRKQTAAQAKKLKEMNEAKPQHEQKIQILQNKIIIDGEVDKPLVMTPQPSDLFPDIEVQKQVDAIQAKMIETSVHKTKNSEFQALAVKVHSIQEVQQAYVVAF